MRFRAWAKEFGGSWEDYLNTPAFVVEACLRVEGAYRDAAQPPARPLGVEGPVIG